MVRLESLTYGAKRESLFRPGPKDSLFKEYGSVRMERRR
jgi:hypothetical protein